MSVSHNYDDQNVLFSAEGLPYVLLGLLALIKFYDLNLEVIVLGKIQVLEGLCFSLEERRWRPGILPS